MSGLGNWIEFAANGRSVGGQTAVVMGTIVSKRHAAVDPEEGSDTANNKRSGGLLGCFGFKGDDESEGET